MDHTLQATMEMCQLNAGKIQKHEANLTALEQRLTRMESKQDQNEISQKEVYAKISEVREKLFNGYDTKISTTNEKVKEIVDLIHELASRGGIDENQIENIITKRLKERDEALKANTHWISRHRIDILSAFMAVCMLVLSILTYLSLMG